MTTRKSRSGMRNAARYAPYSPLVPNRAATMISRTMPRIRLATKATPTIAALCTSDERVAADALPPGDSEGVRVRRAPGLGAGRRAVVAFGLALIEVPAPPLRSSPKSDTIGGAFW